MLISLIDERFLIKQISKFEMDAFVGSANKYFMYMFNEVFDKGVNMKPYRFLQQFTHTYNRYQQFYVKYLVYIVLVFITM